MTRVVVSAIVILLSVLAAVNANYNAAMEARSSAVSCSEVVRDLQSCLPYIRDKQTHPSDKCCDGAKKLNNVVKSKADRQATCDCIKRALKAVGDVDKSRIPRLVKECGLSVKLPPIGANTNCSRVSYYAW